MYTPTKAIVLRSIRYSDADLIAKCYTESDGLKSYMLKGILKTKRGKITSSMFQPFCQLDVIARHRNKGKLEFLKEAKLTQLNPSIRTHVQKSSIAFFLSEVLQNAIQEEEQNKSLFLFLDEAVTWLENHEHIANFHLLFLVKLTRFLGIYPSLTNENDSFFNINQGCFEYQETDKYSVNGDNALLLKKLLTENWEGAAKLKLNQETRQKFLVFMVSYYQIQLQGFRFPKSLEVLNQLFI